MKLRKRCVTKWKHVLALQHLNRGPSFLFPISVLTDLGKKNKMKFRLCQVKVKIQHPEYHRIISVLQDFIVHKKIIY